MRLVPLGNCSTHSSRSNNEHTPPIKAATEREKIKEEKVHGAVMCLACKTVTEFPVRGCEMAGHPLKRVSTTRRFWECTGCGRREAVLSDAPRMPRVNCSRCFQKQQAQGGDLPTWKRCGAGKAAPIYRPNEGLISSFSESTSWKDKFSIERDVLDDRH